ncbi:MULTISPECIES: tRNA pseudouridine(55) synthase TruB [Exiguobacterium]|uniref:tRNA pseudouridine synthase B n=1 Tax=Exiguobacterium aurantiacum TaxID=33987 RepID=A0A377FV30_9BACL|nr:tRNA pseudouridine(55) synthase TruB [Exiguobacterium aurantiacum]STO08424.1 tRNA pseudouridine synthase B [Exiguobacterium aurantiacum]
MEPTGVLILDKDSGMTSHDCVFKLRKLFQTKKVGHTGTLDPEVTGVLPICLGRATKLSRFLTDEGKRYEAEVTIGTATMTEDAHSEVVDSRLVDIEAFTSDEIDQVLQALTGRIEQIPPYYSAVKVNGKKLYEYARKGQTVERPRRMVVIHRLTRTSEPVFADGVCRFQIDVECGKGTFIRTLAVQIGEALGYPAHMSDLRRTRSGSFDATDAVNLETLQALETVEERMQYLIPLEEVIKRWPAMTIPGNRERYIRNGGKLNDVSLEFELFTVYNEEGIPLALYRRLDGTTDATVEVMLTID